MIEKDLLLQPQNPPPIKHHQESVRSDSDANLIYVWIPDVVLNWHDIS